MIIEIKHRWSGEVLFKMETDSWKVAVEAAIKSKADLSRADLSRADLSRADLSEADLSWANLSWADLSEADLSKADLSRADLSPIRDDVWAVLSSAPKETEGLLKALKEGRVDGSTYEGDCACLVGTIANVRGKIHTELGTLKPNSWRPAEKFFLMIKKGDTPENSQPAKIAAEWIEQWLESMKAAFAK